MTTMFRRVLRADEIERALEALAKGKAVEVAGRGAGRIAIWKGGRS